MLVTVENTGRVGAHTYEIDTPHNFSDIEGLEFTRVTTGYVSIEEGLSIFIYFTYKAPFGNKREYYYMREMVSSDEGYLAPADPRGYFIPVELCLQRGLWLKLLHISDCIRIAEKEGKAYE